LAENLLCLDFAARRTDENMQLGKYAEAWNAADKLHYLAASGANYKGQIVW
jgi:hypothetical protein